MDSTENGQLNFPLVSIGMPVYNGEKYIRKAIETILGQDYQNIELIISDNASSDRTADICKEYGQMDSRLKFYQNGENLGAAKNFRLVFQLSRSEYFMWAAHDDYFDKSFISKCLAKLTDNPAAVLCCSEVNFINSQGIIKNETALNEFKNIDTSGMDIPARIRQLLSLIGWVAVYGIIRRPALEKVFIDNPVYGFDVILLLQLLFLGDIIKVPEKLFYYQISESTKSAAEYMYDIAPANMGQAPEHPYTFLIRELFKTVIEADLSPPVKIEIFKVFVEMVELHSSGWMTNIMSENSPQQQTNIFIKGLLFPEKIFFDYLSLNEQTQPKESLNANINNTEFKPENYFYNNGVLLLRQEKYKDAADNFARCIELRLHNYEVFYNLALCLEKLGDQKTARIYFKKAGEIKGKSE